MLRTPRKSLKLFSGIDATAFASILVVLLFVVLFADSWTNAPQRGISTDLPRVRHPIAMPAALREDAMQASVTRDGKIYFGSDQVANSADLSGKIQDRLKDHGVERRVYIRADARVAYGYVKVVLDGVRSAGILRVAFLVDQKRPQTLASR